MLPSGQFNQRIDIQRRTLTSDALQQRVESWENIHRGIPAKVEFGGGTESTGHNETEAHSNYSVTIRRRDGLDTQMRLIWKSLRLNIIAITEDPKDLTGRELILSCRT